MARRPDSTLAWLGTGLVVLTFPFVARATFDESDGGDAVPTEDATIVDTGPASDAGPPSADASRTTFGDDAGGISCTVGAGDARQPASRLSPSLVALAACAALVRRRRRDATE